MTIPIRARLTFWYIGVLTAVLLAFSVGVVVLQQRFSRSQFDGELAALSTAIATGVGAELHESHRLARAARETREDFNVPNRTIAILDGDGAAVAAHWRGYDRTQLPSLAGDAMTATVVQNGRRWRIHRERELSPDGPFQVFVAASEEPLLREQHLLVKALMVGAPLALLFAALISWWTASRALIPLRDMSAQAEAMTLRSLDARLSGGADDEIGQLRRAFNRLLDRLAAGVTAQRQFMADASHELRTPVTAARTAAEVTLSQSHREEEDYRDALGIVAVQTRRLGRMVEDMLVLARADAGGYRLRLTSCALDTVVDECTDAVRVLAHQKGITLDAEISEPLTIDADEDLVRRLVLNLVDNAVKYTPEEGRIRVNVRTNGDYAEVAVSDTGVGIRPQDRERIFDRFVRLDETRDTSAGAGLGLPIARWIAECHHGTLTLDDSGPSGSTFVARFPVTRDRTANATEQHRRAASTYDARVTASNPTVISDTV